ncbi:MAG: hypothetical protein ACFFBS_08085 [Promethearchaeota archaeon]
MYLGLVLLVVGILSILFSQLAFWFRLRMEYGGVKKAFLLIFATRYDASEEDIRKASETELEKHLEKFPLAERLFNVLYGSIIGLFCILMGVILSGLGI